MIEFIHKYPLLIKILLGFVTLAFIVTGYMVSDDSSSDYAAKVGREVISMDDLQRVEGRMLNLYNQVYQGQVPGNMIAKIREDAIDSMVQNKILLLEARKQGIVVTDDEVSRAVTANQTFKGSDGRFDKALYEEALKYAGFTASTYENAIREELAVEKLKEMVKDSVYVPEKEVREAYMKDIAVQKKEFKEEDYAQQRDGIMRSRSADEENRVLQSFVNTLKENYKEEIKINPNIKPEKKEPSAPAAGTAPAQTPAPAAPAPAAAPPAKQ